MNRSEQHLADVDRVELGRILARLADDLLTMRAAVRVAVGKLRTDGVIYDADDAARILRDALGGGSS